MKKRSQIKIEPANFNRLIEKSMTTGDSNPAMRTLDEEYDDG